MNRLSKLPNVKAPRQLIKTAVSCLIVLLSLTSCENETYDAGDGKYSYLRADFGEIRTAEATIAVGGTTDDGTALTFASPYTAQWAAKADTIYRALIYYKDTEAGKSVEPQAISRIPVVKIYETTRPDTVKFDPLTFESAWVSKSGKYLNIGIAVKTGQEEGIDARQSVGLMLEQEETLSDGTRQLRLRFIHDQAGVPEYYSSRTFISLPLKDIAADAIILSVPTYDGWISRTLTL